MIPGAEILPTDIFENEYATPTDNRRTANYWCGVKFGQESMVMPLIVVGILIGLGLVGMVNA